ncbi:MAG: carbohydrate porin [Chitinophagaceae bacterium]|nr:carbohydrate porin [Chitinophagaceae bacterium]
MKSPLFPIIGACCFCTASAAAQADSTAWYSLHGQTTVITQYKPAFRAAYSGTNSLKTAQETQTSLTSTLYLGTKLWKGASLFVNPEIAGGSGLSQALGIADATNGETFRIGDPAPKVYLARVYYTQIFALSDEKEFRPGDLNQLQQFVPGRYLAFTIGKVAIADYFDNNQYSHDPRTQFLSWGLMSNGAWDYPANTRGYTPSIVLEYVTPQHEWRYALSLLPQTANGNTMNWELGHASAQTLEYTHHHSIDGRQGALRLLAFYNTADMGNYRQSLALQPVNPDISATRAYGNSKYGFALNAEQELGRDIGCLLRASWNDGHHETWAFTEIDHSASAGVSVSGSRWKREEDHAGLAFVISGISADHRAYLAAGGTGFMLGDGRLRYGTEQLAETYYQAALTPNLFVTGAYQLLHHPGYNKDRQGPVNIFSIRVHTRI